MGEIMSEKRFELAYEQGNWWAVRDGDITLWKEEVVYLLNSLSEENEQLRQVVDYWQKKYEEGTETFQISENDTTFKFNSNQAQLYTIKSVSPNGVVRLGNGHKAEWRMKDIREISQELPHFEDFNREIFYEIRNKIGAKFDKDVLGRIIYNIYIGTFEEYL